MLAVIHANDSPHQRAYAELMKDGLCKHGIEVRRGKFGIPEPCDFAVVWGFRQHVVMEKAPHTLVMERGHVGDRMKWTSLGWDGLGGNGRYPIPATTGADIRWRWFFGNLMKPWRPTKSGKYALVCGQVPGDAAVRDINISNWITETCRIVHHDWNLPVVYRPHPLTLQLGYPELVAPDGTRISRNGALADDLIDAAVAITYSSTAGVEIVLAGVPLVALSKGSMARDVATHDLTPGLFRPDRTKWAHRLAYTQWSNEEISSGIAWDFVRTRLNG